MDGAHESRPPDVMPLPTVDDALRAYPPYAVRRIEAVATPQKNPPITKLSHPNPTLTMTDRRMERTPPSHTMINQEDKAMEDYLEDLLDYNFDDAEDDGAEDYSDL